MNTLSAVMGRTAGVVLLIPVIVIAGVVAVVALPALALTRRARAWLAARQRDPVAPVLTLEAPPAESALRTVGRRAA